MPKITISIQEDQLQQTEQLAQDMNLSQSELLGLALETFITHHQNLSDTKALQQGDIYWIHEGVAKSDISHPHVVIQDDVLNHSRIKTVVVCALTSNMKKLSVQGNILLDVGEGDLPKQSIIEVAKVSTVNKSQLGEHIGSLDEKRIQQIFAGMKFLQTSFLRS